jgi:PhnB protein
MAKPKPIPDGYRTVTPYLTLKGAAQAIEFYGRAFGARESARMTGPDGTSVMHAELRIGDSVVMLSDEFPQASPRSPETLGGTSASIFLYVPDAGHAEGWARALAKFAEVFAVQGKRAPRPARAR